MRPILLSAHSFSRLPAADQWIARQKLPECATYF